jgi:hypothetical protein
MPLSLTPLTTATVNQLFAEDLRPAVLALLDSQCANNLPLCQTWTAEQLERLQLAALKVSGGHLAALQEAIRLAQTDWRDLLCAAGFAHDPLAHKRWQP